MKPCVALKSLFCGLIELFFSVLGIVIIGIFYEIAWKNSPQSPFNEPVVDELVPEIYSLYTTYLEHLEWNDIDGDSHMSKMLAVGRFRAPKWIKNAPCIYWKANTNWKLSKYPQRTIQHIAHLHYNNRLIMKLSLSNKQHKIHYKPQNDMITVYRINNSNFFTFTDKHRPFMSYNMSNSSNLVESINVSFTDFLQYINNKKYSPLNMNHSYLYYFNSASNMIQDLQPLNWFKMKDKTVQFTDEHIRELDDINHINLDISPAALFINAHYDITHNFYYQIDGTRHILISPPSETLKFRPFPEGHPKYRSSQIPHQFYFAPFKIKSIAKQNTINAWNVTLEPGDLLYVPPFYWTQITTLTNSIAVKLSSLGFEQVFVSLSDPNMLPHILRQPILENEEKQKHVIHQLAFFTRQIIDKILKALPDLRDNINGETVLLSDLKDDLQWNVIHKWIEEQLIGGRYKSDILWNDMKCSDFDALRCPIYGNTTHRLMKEIQQTAKTWAFAYKQMLDYVRNERDVYYIRNMMLATHIEQFVSYITGHSNYCYFLQCLTSDKFTLLNVEQRKRTERMHKQ